MSEIIHLSTSTRETVQSTPDPDCIEVLEEALARARSGEIVGIIAIEQFADHSAGWAAGGYLSPVSSIGCLQIAQHHLLMQDNDF